MQGAPEAHHCLSAMPSAASAPRPALGRWQATLQASRRVAEPLMAVWGSPQIPTAAQGGHRDTCWPAGCTAVAVAMPLAARLPPLVSTPVHRLPRRVCTCRRSPRPSRRAARRAWTFRCGAANQGTHVPRPPCTATTRRTPHSPACLQLALHALTAACDPRPAAGRGGHGRRLLLQPGCGHPQRRHGAAGEGACLPSPHSPAASGARCLPARLRQQQQRRAPCPVSTRRLPCLTAAMLDGRR